MPDRCVARSVLPAAVARVLGMASRQLFSVLTVLPMPGVLVVGCRLIAVDRCCPDIFGGHTGGRARRWRVGRAVVLGRGALVVRHMIGHRYCLIRPRPAFGRP
jgi:hypothetical protein